MQMMRSTKMSVGYPVARAYKEDKFENTINIVDIDEKKEGLMYCTEILNLNTLTAQVQACMYRGWRER